MSALIGTAIEMPAFDLESAFADWKEMAAKINGPDYPADDDAADIARLDALEIAIMTSAAATHRVAEMRLWIGLHHVLEDSHMLRAIERGDINPLVATNADRDWGERFVVSALAALVGQGAVG